MSNFFTRFIKEVFIKFVSLVRSILVYLCVGFLFILIISLIFSGSNFEPKQNLYYSEKEILNQGSQDKIVIVPLTGIIVSVDESNMLTQDTVISPDKIANIFSQIKTDPQVKAVIFDIYSPGGSPVASDRIYEMINDFKKETSIPVISLFGDLAASGAYYIASATDFIVANPSTLTGSIGVIMETYNLEGLYEKLGVNKVTFKEGQYKDILNENRNITDEERQIIQDLNRNTYELFVSRVADGRKLELEYVRSLANGQIYSGKQAYENRLVDSLGNTNEAIYQAQKLANLNQIKVVKYEYNTLFGSLFSASSISSSLSSFFLKLSLLPTHLWQQK